MDHDRYLEQFGLPKGSMTLVDARKSKFVDDNTAHLTKSMTSGGSAANTIHGIAKLGIETGFIGKISKDNIGDVFYKDLIESNIKPHLAYSETETGRAMALVSPDTERTFATYLGAAIELSKEDLFDNHFKGYDIFHIEGYSVQDHELTEAAVDKATNQGMKISIDLASYNIVEENKDFLRYILKDYVDIAFANEEEAKSMTGKGPHGALAELAELCPTAIVKTGRNGSLISSEGRVYEVGVIKVNSIDTTGAGDLYASGYIYGLVKGMPPEICGRIGSLLAGKVIEVMGPKIGPAAWSEISEEVKKIEQN
jgi:sugar/nucleoside kinase (ribokinase family)